MTEQTIAVLDFGSQYTQLIARKIREHRVHSLIYAPTVSIEDLRKSNVAGIVLSGGPASVYEAGASRVDPHLLDLGVPVLGICYGMQALCFMLGGCVERSTRREYGRARLQIVASDPLLEHVPRETDVWMSHGDKVQDIGECWNRLARTEESEFAVVRHRSLPVYGVQFHPEVAHTPDGGRILHNFLYGVCRARGTWGAGSIIDRAIESIRKQTAGGGQVICALSGGVDSAVTATLLQRAMPDRLHCIFVDNGLLRAGERERVEAVFRGHFKIDLRVVDASREFLSDLSGIRDPDEKRRRIGKRFIDVFVEAAESIPDVRYLAQGTLYPDVIESGRTAAGTAATIKLHHNVGGLPDRLKFELIEPLRDMFKDEVRRIGSLLGLPDEIVWRHPFPGPGLAVRIIGEVTEARCALLRQADRIIVEEVAAGGWDRKVSQALGVLLPVSSVGVMGDGRTYADQHVVAVRLVETADFMTADWVHMDPEILGRISRRITNEVRGVNRVVYDITSKPPATIEWE